MPVQDDVHLHRQLHARPAGSKARARALSVSRHLLARFLARSSIVVDVDISGSNPAHTSSAHWTWRKYATGGSESIPLPRADKNTAWHIPQSWINNDNSASGCNATDTGHIIDAAECALHLALANNAFIVNTQIPLITHQTARSADPDTWSKIIRACVEKWLAAATKSDDPSTADMAWFMWDDEGIRTLVQKFEHDLYPAFSALPYPVEKADLFRVLVLKWFGGVVSEEYVCPNAMTKQLTVA